MNKISPQNSCIHLSTLGLLVSAACTPVARTPVQPAPATAPVTKDAVLGTLDGLPIRPTDLPEPLAQRITDIENELAQRRFHLLWAGMEEVVDQRLIEKEAARLGMSADDLRAREIDAKLTAPNEDDVRMIYERNASAIGITFEQAAPQIREHIREKQVEALEQQWLAELRQKADIRYSIPVPELPRYSVDSEDAPALGPESARVTLVEFSDFECPYCSEARHLINELHEMYPDQLRVVFRDFPLGQHPRAKPAAIAAQCAHEQSKFWPYHDLLFENQRNLGDDELASYAKQLELDMDAFNTCRGSDRPAKRVEDNAAAARAVGVGGTPSLFINGIKLMGMLPLPLMKLLIENEMRSSAGGGARN